MNHLRPSDLFVASVPTVASFSAQGVASLTLSDWKDIAGLVGSLLGIAFLVWQWRRAAKRPPGSQAPFNPQPQKNS